MEPSEHRTVRRAIPDDAVRIWEIRNDPAVRDVSTSSAPIALEGHRSWFIKQYFGADTRNHCYVLETNGQVAGYCRLDRDESLDLYIISIALHSAWRGRGLGHALLSRALNEFFMSQHTYPEVIARIKQCNAPSIRLFEKIGFVPSGPCYRLRVTAAGWCEA